MGHGSQYQILLQIRKASEIHGHAIPLANCKSKVADEPMDMCCIQDPNHSVNTIGKRSKAHNDQAIAMSELMFSQVNRLHSALEL